MSGTKRLGLGDLPIEYYKRDGEPKKCTSCNSTKIIIIAAKETINLIRESEAFCGQCDICLGHWSYGCWDDSYFMEVKDG